MHEFVAQFSSFLVHKLHVYIIVLMFIGVSTLFVMQILLVTLSVACVSN
jgi:hypothetical protein